MAFCFLFILLSVNDSVGNIKIAFGSYPYWRPCFASFAGFALGWDPLLVKLDFFLYLPLRLVTVYLIAHWQLVHLGLLLCQQEEFAAQVCDLLFLSTDTLLVPFLVAVL